MTTAEKTGSQPAPRQETDRQKWILLALAAAAILAVLLTYPVLEMGVSDDSSYYRTTLLLAQTGRFQYNGWATAMLGAQMYYGALWVKLIGFSFTGLRLAMLPFTAGCAALLYAISRRASLPPAMAALLTLTVVLSPVYVPLAASYMTDICGFFFYLAGVYCLLRALDTVTRPARTAIGWLAAAAVCSVLGTTVRQPDILIALIGFPYVAWRYRRLQSGRTVAFAAGLLWLVSTAAAALSDRWFAHQLYVLHTTIGDAVRSWFGHGSFIQRADIEKACSGILAAGLLILPVTAFTLPVLWGRATQRGVNPLIRYALPALMTLALTVGSSIRKPDIWPYWKDVFSYQDFWEAMDYIGPAPVAILPLAVRWLLLVGSCLTITLAALLFAVWVRNVLKRRAGAVLPDTAVMAGGAERDGGADDAGGDATLLLVLLCAAYLLLLALRWRMPGGVLLDRYWITGMPTLGILALRPYARIIARKVPPGAWLLPACYAAYAVLASHDHFAISRARLAAAGMLAANGVPREQMYVNFPFDSWTQFEREGYLNDWRITYPRGAYKAVRHPNVPGNLTWYDADMSGLNPSWLILVDPNPALANTRYPAIPVATLLPPYGRIVVIHRLDSPAPAPQAAVPAPREVGPK